MNKRNFYITILFTFQVLHINLFSQGIWERIASPTDHQLRSVYFVDSLYGWAVGDSGTIIHTTNGGTGWSFQNSETENIIVDVFFLNRDLGWASSWNTSTLPLGTDLLKTTNGGQKWISNRYRDDNLFMQTILFTDSLNGWLGGKPHALVSTTDGGVNWKQADIDTSIFAFFPVSSIKFYNSQYGYASGGAFERVGLVWRTTNGGNKWFVIEPDFAPPDPILEIHIFDSMNVIGIGGDFEVFGVGIIRTTDGGLFWEYDPIGIAGVAWDFDFRNDHEAWATQGVHLIYSLDAGVTWTQISTPDSSDIADIIFPDSLHGFAVGKDGAIIKYKPPVISSVNETEAEIPKTFELSQNYPNPFNSTTTIRYELPESANVTLRVYSILGEEVASLDDEQKEAGRYEVQFSAIGGSASGGNASSLASGIYIYRINTSNFTASKKLILMK